MTSLTMPTVDCCDVIEEEKMTSELTRPRSKMEDLLDSPHFLNPKFKEVSQEEGTTLDQHPVPSVCITNTDGEAPKVSGQDSKPRLMGIVEQAMNKQKEKIHFSVDEPLRRKSGPSSIENSLSIDERHLLRRKSDIPKSVRIVRRKSSAHEHFRRHSMRPSIIPNAETPDPLEFLLEHDVKVINKTPCGALRRLFSNFRSEHLSGLFSGLSIGVSAGLVVKSVLILLTLLWTLGTK